MNRIKALRKSLNLSQDELSKMLHVHQTSVSQWENEKTFPDMRQAIELAILFDVSIDHLLGRSSNPTPTINLYPHNITDEDLKLALFGEANNISDDMLQQVKNFAEFINKKNPTY